MKNTGTNIGSAALNLSPSTSTATATDSVNNVNFNINPVAHDSTPTTSSRKRFITSCVTCRRRKVRCDRQKPMCVRCTVSGHSCSYITEQLDIDDHPPMGSFAHREQIGRNVSSSSESPPAITSEGTHGHQPHTRKRDRSPHVQSSTTQHSSSMLQRLRKLEEIVAQLGSQANPQLLSLASQQELLNASSNPSRQIGVTRVTRADKHTSPESSSRPTDSPESLAINLDRSPGSGLNPGKLFNEGGRTRYVSSLCWELITDEIQDLSLRVQDSLSQQDSTERVINQQGTTCDTDAGASNPVTCSASYNPTLSSSSLIFSPASSTGQFSLPPRAEFDYLYSLFKHRVDPMLRLLHIPSLMTAIEYYFTTSLHPRDSTSLSAQPPPRGWQIYRGNSRASFEALLFSVLHGTINALHEEELVVAFSTGKITHGVQFPSHPFSSDPNPLNSNIKASLLRYYRSATEQSLVRARFLEKSDIVTVLAFTTLLVCLNQEPDIPILYPLTGLLLRIAQSLGLHRDPSLLFPGTQASSQPTNGRQLPMKDGISPVEAELRRRVWHHICHLDLRASERNGPDPGNLLDENMWPAGPGTSFPRCIDDEDLSSEILSEDDQCLPSHPCFHDPGRFTSMTSLLVRFNASFCFRRIQTVGVPPFSGIDAKTRNIIEQDLRARATAEVESMVTKNTKLLKYCVDEGGEGDTPILKRMTVSLVTIVELKVRILYYYRFEKGREKSPEEQLARRESIMHQALDLIQCFHNIYSDPEIYPYHWHLDAHIPFHPLFHLLSELCTPTFRKEKYRELRNKARTLLHAMAYISDPDRQDGLPRSTCRGKEWSMVRRLLRLVDNGSNGAIQLPSIQSSGGLSTNIDINRPITTIDTRVPTQNPPFGPEITTQFPQDAMDTEQSFPNSSISLQPEINWANYTGFGFDQYDWDEMSRLVYMDFNFM